MICRPTEHGLARSVDYSYAANMDKLLILFYSIAGVSHLNLLVCHALKMSTSHFLATAIVCLPPSLQNATVNITGDGYNMIMEFTCIPGHKFPDMDLGKTISCLPSAQWNETLSDCERKIHYTQLHSTHLDMHELLKLIHGYIVLAVLK